VVTYDGETDADRKLWHTYLYWARQEARYPCTDTPMEPKAIVDDQAKRIGDDTAAALRIIVFSCFALEYRLKRILKALKAQFSERENFGKVFSQFWNRLSEKERLDGKGKCIPPSEWSVIETDLKSLIQLRNNIAHANYSETLQFISGSLDPVATARKFYNALVDAIRLVNQGTGYDVRDPEELKEYFGPLRV